MHYKKLLLILSLTSAISLTSCGSPNPSIVSTDTLSGSLQVQTEISDVVDNSSVTHLSFSDPETFETDSSISEEDDTDLTFLGYITDDDTYTITEVAGDIEDKDIVFPEFVDGIPVKRIETGGSWDSLHNKCRSVTVPGSVSEIGNDAFYGLRMESVDLKEGIQVIESSAFGKNRLESISFPEGCKFAEGTFGIISDNELDDVYLPESVGESLSYDSPFLLPGDGSPISTLKTTVHIPAFGHTWSPLLCQGYKVVAEGGSSLEILGEPVSRNVAFDELKKATGIDFGQYEQEYGEDGVIAVENKGFLHLRIGTLLNGLPGYEAIMEALEPFDGRRYVPDEPDPFGIQDWYTHPSTDATAFRNRDKDKNSYVLDWFDVEDADFALQDYVFPETETLVFANPVGDATAIYAIIPMLDENKPLS